METRNARGDTLNSLLFSRPSCRRRLASASDDAPPHLPPWRHKAPLTPSSNAPHHPFPQGSTLNSGHYFAYVKSPSPSAASASASGGPGARRWHECNDSWVAEASRSDVLGQRRGAYMVGGWVGGVVWGWIFGAHGWGAYMVGGMGWVEWGKVVWGWMFGA